MMRRYLLAVAIWLSANAAFVAAMFMLPLKRSFIVGATRPGWVLLLLAWICLSLFVCYEISLALRRYIH